MRRSRITVLAAAAVAALGLVACGDDDGADPAPPADGLTVYTSEALEGVVTALADAFSDDSGTAVTVTAVEQVDMVTAVGSDDPPDYLVLADAWFEQVEAAREDLEANPFGRNLVVVITPPGNPADATGVEDFAADGPLRTAICGPETELGNFGALALQRAGITPDPDTVGSQCEAEVADRLVDGDLDAALVFRAQLGPRDDVDQVEVPDDDNWIFELSHVEVSPSSATAAFAAFIESDEGRALRESGGVLP